MHPVVIGTDPVPPRWFSMSFELRTSYHEVKQILNEGPKSETRWGVEGEFYERDENQTPSQLALKMEAHLS